jgi:hypothetical protein
MRVASSLVADFTRLVHMLVQASVMARKKTALPARQIVRYPVGIPNVPRSVASLVHLVRKASVFQHAPTAHARCLVRPLVTMFHAH